ncbi:MAG: hypothetical protein JWM21_2973 [Acidobacteria bacterium]|nr:hypothetical protein [Acidobacteriota bacterium]
MKFFSSNNPSDPHAGRRVPLTIKRGQSASEIIKSAIWTLIENNCDPPRPFNTKSIITRQPDATAISDIFVQTFYVVYPPSTFQAFASLKADEIAGDLIQEMVQDQHGVFDSYLRDKIGASVWTQATADDNVGVARRHRIIAGPDLTAGTRTIPVGAGAILAGSVVTIAGQNYLVKSSSPGSLMIEPGLRTLVPANTEVVEVTYRNRINAAKVARLVEVLLHPVENETEPCVVGRESLAVEVVRLRDQGKDPRVIAQIYVQGSANVNPHTRESQRSKSVGRGDTICVIEGRATSVFFIGPNAYDDIQVEGMPSDEWYQLRVLSPDQFPVRKTLADRAGRPINQMPNTQPATWQLGLQDRDGWSCTLEVMEHPNITISQVTGLPELPPSIKLVGRVLPRDFKPPQELEAHLQNNAITCVSAIRLEGKVYLYASHDGNSYVVDLDGSSNITVEPPQQILPNTYLLEERTFVTIGRMRFIWLTNGLPQEVIGRLSYERSEDCPSESLPVVKGSANSWVIGRQHRTDVMMRGTPLFSKTQDQYLSRSGNVVIKYVDTDLQDYPVFKLVLLSGGELPLFVKPSATGQWRSGPWPWPKGLRELVEIPGVEFNGVSNGLIIGTSYFDIATRHTLRPIQ